MVGAFGFDAKVLQNDPATGLPEIGVAAVHYQDVGFDAQYQYLLSPHAITATLRSVQEKINDDASVLYTNGPATLNTLTAKASYVYRATYGGSLTYHNVTGSADPFYASAAEVPDTERWVPEMFWIPSQNIRVGLQFNMYTKYMGAANNYDGNGRNASDNDTTYLYFWTAF